MLGYRVNKYCGELLNIGNEVWPENDQDDDNSVEKLNEPVAEARIHLEQNFHQFTNLKIIKAEASNESQQAIAPRVKSNADLKLLKVVEKEKAPKNKIYSQVI